MTIAIASKRSAGALVLLILIASGLVAAQTQQVYRYVDPEGRVVVSGRGYIRILAEDPATGKAGQVLEFTAAPKDGAVFA